MTTHEQPLDTEPKSRRIPATALVPLAAAVWWIGGFLPWLLSGLDGSGFDSRRGVGDTALAIPLTIDDLGPLVQGCAVGGLLAGLLGAFARPAARGLITLATFGGTMIAAALAIALSVTTILRVGGVASYEVVLILVSLVAVFWTLVGWGVGATAVLGRPGLCITLATLAGFGGSWLGAVATQFVPVEPYESAWLNHFTAWTTAVVLAVALALLGWRPRSRLALWPVLVALPWFIVSGLVATSYLGYGMNSRIASLDRLPDTIDSSISVFWAASSPETRSLLPWAFAIVAGIAGAALLARRRSP